jgi:regulatory protein
LFAFKMDYRITALKVQTRNPNRVNLYLDGDFAFGVSRIVAAWLRVDQILTEEKIASLKGQEAQEAALQRAMQLLSYRPRAEAEIRQRLEKAGFEPGVIAQVLERLRATGLVQDAGFAREWVENRGTFRPRSHKMLAYELRRKGVTEDAIQQALDETSADEVLAYQAAVRYARKLAGTESDEFRRRLLAYLGRRGFSYETAVPIVLRVWRELHQGVEDARIYDDKDE